MEPVIVGIDVDDLVRDFLLTKDEVNDMYDSVIKDITGSFAKIWEQVAVQTLKSTRQQYIDSLVIVDEGFAKGAVVLVGVLPNMLEAGVSGFDMQEGLLNGPNAKIGKDGKRYNTVPFKAGAPGSLKENFNGGVLPSEVHSIVKTFKTDPITGKSRQTIKEDLPQEFQQPKVKSIGTDRSYTHKNSIYEGVRKSQDRAGNVSYESFRRVSENSDPDAWQHPGLEAQNLAEKALAEFDIPNEMGLAIDRWLARRNS